MNTPGPLGWGWELIFKTYKELKNTDSKKKKKNKTKQNKKQKTHISVLKMGYRAKQKHLQKYSTSLVIKEMEIKTTLIFYLIPIRIA
jgi:hypothetical protein